MILGHQGQPSSDHLGVSPPAPELGCSPGSVQGSLGTFSPALPRGQEFPRSLCGRLHSSGAPGNVSHSGSRPASPTSHVSTVAWFQGPGWHLG